MGDFESKLTINLFLVEKKISKKKRETARSI